MRERTLGEAMCLAYLRGDIAAARALADQLLNELNGGHQKQIEAAKALIDAPIATDGYLVFRWPEFEAFCRRAGILFDLRTYSISFTIRMDEPLKIEQVYQGSDVQSQTPEVIDTTTLQNRQFRTTVPSSRPEEGGQ